MTVEYISLVVLCLTGLRWFLVLSGSYGGGQTLDSPNEIYKANAMTFRVKRFWGGKDEFYRLWVRNRASSKDIFDIRIKPSNDKPLFEMRGGKRIIAWSEDSSNVTFSFQDFNLSFKVTESQLKP